MDSGARQATVHGVTKSGTRRKRLSTRAHIDSLKEKRGSIVSGKQNIKATGFPGEFYKCLCSSVM